MCTALRKKQNKTETSKSSLGRDQGWGTNDPKVNKQKQGRHQNLRPRAPQVLKPLPRQIISRNVIHPLNHNELKCPEE